jgi:hypothetical protein
VDSSIAFGVTIKQISRHSCSVDIAIHMPLTIYWYIVPKILYADITRASIETKLKAGQKTDGYIQYGYKNLESAITGFDICEASLLSSTEYTLTVYYKSFKVQTTVAAAPASSAVAVAFDPLKFTDISYYSFLNGAKASTTVVPTLDDGKIWTSITMDRNGAGMGYFNMTFNSDLTKTQIESLCCYTAQVLEYPLENIWTAHGYRCPSPNTNMPANIFYYTACVRLRLRELLLLKTPVYSRNYMTLVDPDVQRSLGTKLAGPTQERILAKSMKEIQVYILRNLRSTQNNAAYGTAGTYLYPSTFETT